MSNLFDPIFFNICQSVGTEKGGEMILVWILKDIKTSLKHFQPLKHEPSKGKSEP